MTQGIFCIFLTLLLSGCALKTEELPNEMVIEKLYGEQKDQNISETWWRDYNVEALTILVENALSHNHDMISALEKIKQAELQLRIAGVSLFPSASLSASTSSKHSTSVLGNDWQTNRSSGISLGVSYEIDLWGKIDAMNKVALSSFKATQYDWQTVRLSLISGVVSGYFEYCSLSERIVIAQQNLDDAKRLLAIVEARYQEGSVSALDVSRQQSTLLSQEATLLSLHLTKRELLHSLALLAGITPHKFTLEEHPFETIVIPNVEADIPSQLLLNRPDIASAYAQSQGAKASIDATAAKRFPSFSLSGSGGLGSAALLAMRDPSGALSSSLGLAYNLFDGGKTEYEISIEESKERSLLASYHRSVLNALKEVEDALATHAYNKDKGRIQDELLIQSERSLNLALEQYKQGATDFSTLLDAQRSFYQVKDQMIQQRLSTLQSTVTLYKVFGGGWKR